MKRPCPELKAAALEGRIAPSEEHARSCPECARERAAIAELVALGQELPWTPPTAPRVEEIRSAVLATRKPRRSERRWIAIAAAAAIAVAAAGAVLLMSRERAEVRPVHATIESAPAARFVHLTGDATRVRLPEGDKRSLNVKVAR